MDKPKILIVDDESEARGLFKQYLTRRLECNIKEASSGRAALELIAKEGFDLILLDVRMPGISGLDVLKKAKATHPETEVLMITAYDSHQVAREALTHGALDLIVKPSTIEVIFDKVKQALEKRNKFFPPQQPPK